MRVTNRHTSDIDGHAPGTSFDVDPYHAAWAPLLRGGLIVPASAADVRMGANDPPPSPAAVRELIAGVNARNREIDALHESLEALTRDRDGERAKTASLQARVNELEAVLALRAGATPDDAPIHAAVAAAEATLTARFDAAYAELRAKHDALASDNAKLKADLDALQAAPKAEAPEPTKPAKPRG